MVKKSFFAFILLALVGLFLELVLLLAVSAAPALRDLLDPRQAMVMPDELLQHRPNPRFFEHDARGFRNESARTHAYLVALGDSFTYGAMVAPEHAWPRQIEADTGLATYNMAFGGYGPGHALLLMDEALELNPSVIVFGMYAGNDLFDCFSLVYHGTSLVELRSEDDAVSRRIEERDRAGLIGAESRARKASFGRRLYKAVRDHSRLYGLARAVRNVSRGSVWQFESPSWEDVKERPLRYGEALFESERAQTVFTIRTRLAGLDLTDVRIEEGLRIGIESIRRMNEKARERGVEFAVALFPTKELAFEDLVEETGRLEANEQYAALAAFEKEMWNRTRASLDSLGVPYCDTLEPLKRMLAEGNQPFRTDSDGHLNAEGNRAVATRIYACLEDLQMLPPPGARGARGLANTRP